MVERGGGYDPFEPPEAHAHIRVDEVSPPCADHDQRNRRHIRRRAGSAIDDLEKVVKLSQDDAQSGEALAMAYIERKRLADADRLIADLVRRWPDDPAIANMVGLSDLAQSRVPEARAALETVGKKFPDFIPSQLELAKIYETQGILNQTGKKADAQGLLKKAVDNNLDFESKGDAQALLSQLSN